MPGANLGFELVPLASAGETFAILGRFPAGFDRSAVGGYFSAEEFLVLDGSLEIEGQQYVRGDLTFIPSYFLRTRMLSPQGCTVLAWFGGPAIFRTADELGNDALTVGITSVRVDALLGEDFMVTPEARWSVGRSVGSAVADEIDLELSRWRHGKVEAGDLTLRRTPIVQA